LRKRKGQLRRRLAAESGGGFGVAALSVGIWVSNGASGNFWPAWVIGFALLPVIRDGWRLLGPSSDLEVVEARMQARHERRLMRGRRYRYRGLPW
jgi:hypothetical protein